MEWRDAGEEKDKGDGGGGLMTHIGEHCSVSDCRQLDFLPFKCRGCGESFCLDHHRYESHQCPHAPTHTLPASGAPPRGPGERANHKPKRSKAKRCVQCRKKQMCPIRCNDCGSVVCVSHRWGDEHDCARRKAAHALERLNLLSSSNSNSKPSHTCRQNTQATDTREELNPPQISPAAQPKPCSAQASAARSSTPPSPLLTSGGGGRGDSSD